MDCIALQPLSSSEALDLKYKGGIATLAINEVFPEDEGQYTCKATNAMGTAETTCKLTVKRKSAVPSPIKRPTILG